RLGRLQVLLVHQRARDSGVRVGVEVARLAGVDLLLGDELVGGLRGVRVQAQVADHVVVFDARDAAERGAPDAGRAAVAGGGEDLEAGRLLLHDHAAAGAGHIAAPRAGAAPGPGAAAAISGT